VTPRVGLLGGTFDPVHVGHLDVAHAARRALGLEFVAFVPSHVPMHRQPPAASAAHRFAMTALALDGHPDLRLWDTEIARGGPSFTVDTLDRLAGAGQDLREVVFITGADAFRDIATWKAYPDVLSRCHFAVVSRPGLPAPSLAHLLPGLAARMHETPCAMPPEPAIFLVDAPTNPASSTEVRDRLGRGESIEGLVPAAVGRYIAREGLYRPAGVA
jgi:nicotinate-nucleotide adenylyltransferase